MKKFTRRERKIYKQGKAAGYIEGYAKGLHDGNPFIALGEAAAKVVASLGEMITDPEFVEYAKAQKFEEKDGPENETF